MATTAFATVEDVEASWGELTIAEAAKVQGWLETASNNLRLLGIERGTDIDSFIFGNAVLTAGAKDAVVESIRRRLINPTGVRQRSNTVTDGPFSDTTSETIDSAISSGTLYFTDDDLRWLPVKRRASPFRSFRVQAGLR